MNADNSVIIKTWKTVLEYVKTINPETVCRRGYLEETDTVALGNLGKPLITVALYDRNGETITQGRTLQTKLKMQIGVQKKLEHIGQSEKLTEEIDPLIALIEEIYHAFMEKVVLGADGFRVACQKPTHETNAPLYDPERILAHQFLGIVMIDVLVTHHANEKHNKLP